MAGDLNPQQFITDEFKRWQQGQCGTYACALLKSNPKLRLGGLDYSDEPEEYTHINHFVAHDDTHAYDSGGKHPLPYTGRSGEGRWAPDLGDPEDYGLPHDEAGPEGPEPHLRDALAHARRNRIIDW